MSEKNNYSRICFNNSRSGIMHLSPTSFIVTQSLIFHHIILGEGICSFMYHFNSQESMHISGGSSNCQTGGGRGVLWRRISTHHSLRLYALRGVMLPWKKIKSEASNDEYIISVYHCNHFALLSQR